MMRHPNSRLRRAAGFTAALGLAGALAAGAANSVRVPNGGNPEGAVKCAAGNPNTARFSQSCGALVTLTAADTTPAYVQDNSPSGEVAYRARFYVNPRLVNIAGAGFDVFAAYDGADPTPPANAGNAVFRVVLQQSGAQKQLAAFARTNGGTETPIGAISIANAWRSIEVDWARGAGNGHLNLWIDGKPQTGLTALTNDTLSINYVRWGAVAGLDGNATGSFRMDDFVSQRSTYIGPALPFSDIATASPFFPFIQGIYAAEVIPDCGVGTFCPNGLITRKEMAKFLLLAKNGASYTPPVCTTATFADVPCSHPYADWIYEIKNEGITSGCDATHFCPDGSVTRSQMAVFLMVAHGNTPGSCPPSTFADVPGNSPFCPWINLIASLGITAGCGGGNFCPNDSVLRGQMSVFLSTTFTIPTHVVGP